MIAFWLLGEGRVITVYRGINSKMTRFHDFPTVLMWAEWDVLAEGTCLGTGEGSCKSVCMFCRGPVAGVAALLVCNTGLICVNSLTM